MKKFKKLLSVILAVMMVMSVMPSFASTGGGTGGSGSTVDPIVAAGGELIFSEDFESGYTKDTNLLESDGSATIQKNGADVLKLSQPSAAGLSAMSVKVVNDTKNGFNSNVLEIKNTDTANAIEMYIYINGGTAIDVNDTSSPYYGKQLIYEYDAKIANYKENKFMGISSSTANGFQRASNAAIFVSSGPYAVADTSSKYGTVEKRNWYSRLSPNPSLATKATIRYVVEQMAAVDTIRTYRDGVLSKNIYNYATQSDCSNYGKVLKDYVGENYVGAATLDYGSLSYLYSKILSNGSGNTATVYIDNIKVYAVDPIKYDSANTDFGEINPEAGFDISFTQPVDKDTLKTSLGVSLANGSTIIEGAVSDVVLSNNNCTATVKFDFSKLNAKTKYKLWLDDEFTSAAGAVMYKDADGVSDSEEWKDLTTTFTTCDKLEVASVIPTGFDNYNEGDEGEVTFTFSSDLAEAVDPSIAFEVVDEDGNVLPGDVTAEKVGTDGLKVDIAGIWLGEGKHTIKTVAGTVYNNAGIGGSASYEFTPVAFDAVSKSASVSNYVEGTDESVSFTFNRALADEGTFTVTDSNNGVIAGNLNPYFVDGENGRIVAINLSGLKLGEGEHTITGTFTSRGGAEKAVTYTFTTEAFGYSASPESNTIEGYELGNDREITLTLNRALADGANLDFTVSPTGETIAADVDAERKVVTLNLADLTGLGRGTHTITGTLTSKGGVQADVSYKFGILDFFTTKVKPASLNQYVPGTKLNISIELSMAVGNDVNISDAFEIVDAEGTPVTPGLTAVVDSTRKNVTLKLESAALEAGKTYTIKSKDTFVGINGNALPDDGTIEIPFTAVEEIFEATMIFSEDFESGYTKDTNLLESDGSATIQKNGADVLKLSQPSAAGLSAMSVKVVNDTENGFNSNVLEIKNTDTADAVEMYIYINGGTAIDVNDTSSPYYGKQLIFEYDAKIANYKENKFMGISTGTTNGFQRGSVNGIVVSSGAWATSSATYDKRNWFSRPDNPSLATKATIRYVVEQGAAVDTIRTYRDGVLVKNIYNHATQGDCSNYGKVLKDYVGETYAGAATLNYGSLSYLYSKILSTGSGNTAAVYIDNIKVYAVDPINFADENNKLVFAEDVDKNNFNPSKGFDIEFTQRINENTLKNALSVSLANDATNAAINNAIKKIELSGDGKSAHVTLNFGALEQKKSYKVWLDDEFTSDAGAIMFKDHDGVAPEEEIVLLGEFKTCEKLTAVISDAIITGYDKGIDKVVTITFGGKALAADVDINNAFVVKDGDENEIQGLEATLSDDRKTVTLQLKGLQLGDGTHTIDSVDGALYDDNNSQATIYVELQTVDFTSKATPYSNSVSYEEGTEQAIEIVLSTPTVVGKEDIASCFEVKDSNGAEVSGLAAALSDDGKTITLQLKDLVLGEGDHTITSTSALIDSRGRKLGFEYKFKIKAFTGGVTSGSVIWYEQGTDKEVTILMSLPADVTDTSNCFVVKDSTGKTIDGLTFAISEDKRTITLQLKGLELGIGDHTITASSGLVDSKGRVLAANAADESVPFSCKFTVLPFKASYSDKKENYVVGEDEAINIILSYPLTAEAAAAVKNAFVVTNNQETAVSGLGVEVSEDKMTVILKLKDLAINGGKYIIKAPKEAFVNAKGEIIDSDIEITLTTEGYTEETVENSGVITESVPSGGFESSILIDENFDSYEANVNWLTAPAFTPEVFVVSSSENGKNLKDSQIMIVADPKPSADNPNNKVLKYKTDVYNTNNEKIAGKETYHTILRKLDSGDASKAYDTTDTVKLIALSTRVYIEDISGSPGDSNNDTASDTKDVCYIISASSDNNGSPIGKSNYRKNGYASYTSGNGSGTDTIKGALSSNEWHDVVFVYSNYPNASGANMAGYAVYIDGTRISQTKVGDAVAADFKTIGGIMARLVPTSGGSGGITVYYDDWKLEERYALLTNVSISSANVKEDENIKISFTNELIEESINAIVSNNLVTVTDAEGNSVEVTVTAAADNKNELNVVPRFGLKHGTDYVIQLPATYVVKVGSKDVEKAIYDDFGNQYGGFVYNFATEKSESVAIAFNSNTLALNASVLEESTNITYAMKLDDEVYGKELVAAVATFGEDNELLGIEYKPVPVDYDPATDTVDFDFESKKGAKYVKLYIWEKQDNGTLNLLHVPDVITSK